MRRYFILILIAAMVIALNVVFWLWLSSDNGGLRVELLK